MASESRARELPHIVRGRERIEDLWLKRTDYDHALVLQATFEGFRPVAPRRDELHQHLAVVRRWPHELARRSGKMRGSF